MGGGPDNVTSTTETKPSPYLTPGIQQAASAAQNQFSGGQNPVFNRRRRPSVTGRYKALP